GKIGGEFICHNPDGSQTTAILLAIDRDRDVALYKVPADEILGHSWVPHKNCIPEVGYYSAVGYTGGRGPEFKNVNRMGNKGWKSRGGTDIWSYRVKTGDFGGGDSGGGVFKNGA